MAPRTVLLLTYGEPPTPDFLDQLKYSWRILLGLTRSVAPIPYPLLPLIAWKRGRLRTKMWAEESYGSPLEAITNQQVEQVREALKFLDPRTAWDVRAAYEFRDPLLADVIASLPSGAHVDVVPMYAACSAFTHDLSRRLLASLADTRLRGRRVHVHPPLPEDALAMAMARHVKGELEARKVRTGADWALLLVAHGTLMRPPRPFETGRVATERLAGRVAAQLRGDFGHIRNAWLNHVYGGEWTSPPADVALADLVAKGIRKVVYFPFGFLADNAESELEGRQALRTQPSLEGVHLPCLNASPKLARIISRQVAGALPLRGR